MENFGKYIYRRPFLSLCMQRSYSAHRLLMIATYLRISSSRLYSILPDYAKDGNFSFKYIKHVLRYWGKAPTYIIMYRSELHRLAVISYLNSGSSTKLTDTECRRLAQDANQACEIHRYCLPQPPLYHLPSLRQLFHIGFINNGILHPFNSCRVNHEVTYRHVLFCLSNILD